MEPVSGQVRQDSIPRAVLIGAAALVAFALVLTVAGRMSGFGIVETPRAELTQSRDLRFEDRADGAVVVYDVEAGRVIDVFPSGEGGFVRGVLRGLARERMLHGVDSPSPVRLVRGRGGALTLEDPSTGRLIDLTAFGPTNAGAFARLLVAEAPAQSGPDRPGR